MTLFLDFVYLLGLAIILIVLYYVIKAAVRNGIKEARRAQDADDKNYAAGQGRE